MASTSPALALVALSCAVSGCLPAPESVEGTQIFAGRDIENLSVQTVQGQTQVLFETRRRLPSPGRPGSVDMWVLPLSGATSARKYFEGRSDSWPAVRQGGESPSYWVAVNQRERTVGGRSLAIADRVRVDLSGAILEQIPDVSDFNLLGGGWKSFRRPLPNDSAVALHVRNNRGAERVFEDVTGAVEYFGDGLFYVGGAERTLFWVPNLESPAEPLRSGTTRLRLRARDNFAILTVPEQGRAVDVVYDLQRRTERVLPGDQICCWLDFSPDDSNVWRYAEARTEDAPARYHEFHVRTGEHVVRDLPQEMGDVIRMERRPQTEDVLVFDSYGTIALYNPAANPFSQVLPLTAPNPRFTNDGRHLLYVLPESLIPSPQGPLMIQDVAFSAPPRQLSGPGVALSLNSFYTIEDEDPSLVVFWGSFGTGPRDLYFAPLEVPGLRRVAEGVRGFEADSSRFLGIVRTSVQDLVGDLVIKSLVDDQELVLGRSVDTYRIIQDEETKVNKVLYLLRTRRPAGVEGLWVRDMPEM